jgi:Fe-S cluster assembly protein SufD
MATQVSTDTTPAQDLQTLVGLRSQLTAQQAPQLDAVSLGQLNALRDQAANRTQELTFPTPRDEEWQFTDISNLRQVSFQLPGPTPPIPLEAIQDLLLPELSLRLVFVNGGFVPQLSSVAELPVGLRVEALATLSPSQTSSLLPSQLGQLPGGEEVWTTLNTASFTDLAIIQVQRQTEIAQPLHLLWLTVASNSPILSYPRCFITVEAGAKLTLIEEFATLSGSAGIGITLTNGVTEITLGQNAQLDHSRVQLQSADAGVHIGKTAVTQARDSRYTCHAISLGAQISRHNLDVHSTGEQTETHLNGLTFAMGEQLADTHSSLVFNAPHGTSNQVHKCVVGDRARAVFNGKIVVPKAAQLTNANQLSRNLLLSNKAKINTKPQLEIVADNVKCTHGATVSQLEADEIFYLQSRGLDYQSATDLLVKGFALESLLLLPIDSLRQRITDQILTQLHP